MNPVSYFLLSKFIAKEWSKFAKVYDLSHCSGSRPKFPKLSASGRAIVTTSVASKRSEQRHLASVYPVILNLDINNFYGSIYTHAIPWAVLGKKSAKEKFRNGTLSQDWSDSLDKLVRQCNQRQTVGLAIGPDPSRIVSELILARIDRELTEKGSGLSNSQIFHNIDDYQFGVGSLTGADSAQSLFVRAISKFELRLNDFKTRIDEGIRFSPALFQRHFDHLRGKQGKEFVEHFFERLYTTVEKFRDDNIVGYALKRFSKSLAKNSEKGLVKEYLQRLLLAQPHQARWIVPLLIGVYKEGTVDADIRRIISEGCENCARRNDVGSLSWFLYCALSLDIKLGVRTCAACLGLSNELIDLMLFHGRDKGLFSPSIVDLRSRYGPSGFRDSEWLVLYEVGRRGWDNHPAFQKIGTADDVNNYYAQLRQGNVEFYLSDAPVLEVSALPGWKLSQADFATQVDNPFEWEDLDGDWFFEENYP